ncbi:MAG TPA: hypothetical protein VM536_05965 [Chloroflexia bacterium]|nr:hypothetical protein [Chloroflexia bacterium]
MQILPRTPTQIATVCLLAAVLVVIAANRGPDGPRELRGSSAVLPRQTFADVPPNHPFWLFVERVADRQVLEGVPCGEPGEPCDAQGRPYFHAAAPTTVGELAAAIALARRYREIPEGQTFADVPPTSLVYLAIERLARRGILPRQACGDTGWPCDAQNRPYVRVSAPVTRGDLAQILAAVKAYDDDPMTQTFTDVPLYLPYHRAVEQVSAHGMLSGYSCGAAQEPCDEEHRPYFRGGTATTRSQLAKALSVMQGYSLYPVQQPAVLPSGH